MTAERPSRLPVTYVLPLRSRTALDAEAVDHLRELVDIVDEIIVVDGSAPEIFEIHDRALPDPIVHVAPDPCFTTANGKVAGVMTGLHRARHDLVVLADDDVRYGSTELEHVVGRLAFADAVCPQNVFVPLPWHARWDTSRMLIHRAIGHDMPGTIAVRRSVVLALGGYDGDVLFENLELLRTIGSAGGRVHHALDVFVARRPPDTRRFIEQRVRQAYDEFARPILMFGWLSILPSLAWLAARRRVGALIGAVVGSVAIAEIGRRRAGGQDAFRPAASLWAPPWVVERALCSWLAVIARARGGVPYGDRRIARAATPIRQLRARPAPAPAAWLKPASGEVLRAGG